MRMGIRAEVILSHFWRDETSDVAKAIELEGWMDVLEPFAEIEVRTAWAEYQRSGPRSARGMLIKPDAGAIRLLIADARRVAFEAQRAKEPVQHEPLRRITPDELAAKRRVANELLRASGLPVRVVSEDQP